MKNLKKLLSITLSITLITSAAVFMTACGSNDSSTADTSSTTETAVNEVGEGEHQFTFIVVGEDETEVEYLVHTDTESVSQALLDVDLIAGEESDMGLYVTTVDGVTLDYATDGAYWGLYVDDEFSEVGISDVEFKDDIKIEFKYTKA